MGRLAMQQRHRGPRTTAEAAEQNGTKGHTRYTAYEFSDRTDVRWERLEELQIAQREPNSRIIDGGTEYGEMDIVEGSTTAYMEEDADNERAGLVESTAQTLGVRARKF
jgi:hypothetical protein